MPSINSCLTLQYWIIASIGVLLFFLKKKNKYAKYLLLLVFMFGWRKACSYYFNMSSRYYCATIITLLPFYLLVFHALTKKASVIVLSGIIVANIFITYSSFRNLYVEDAVELISNQFAKDYNSFFLIQNKEYQRLGNNIPKRVLLFKTDYPSKELVQSEIDYYKYWGSRLFFIFFKKKEDDIDNINNTKKISSFKTNTSKTNEMVILETQYSNEKDSFDTLTAGKGHFFNGKMEIVETRKAPLGRIKEWSNKGAGFYKTETILFPQFDVMLQTWVNPLENGYPQVFLDDSTPIEGKYSLNITFTKGTNNRVALLQKIKATKGVLKIKIKSKTPETILHLSMIDYLNKKAGKRRYIYGLFINDSDPHEYMIEFNDDDFKGEEAILYLEGNNSNILIDDIDYYSI